MIYIHDFKLNFLKIKFESIYSFLHSTLLILALTGADSTKLFHVQVTASSSAFKISNLLKFQGSKYKKLDEVYEVLLLGK